MPRSFAEVYQLFRDLHSEGALPATMDLNKFARFANDITQTDDFKAGDSNWFGETVKKGFFWRDKAIDWTGAPEKTGDFGEWAFEKLGGNPETGREVGQSIPSGFADLATMFIPGIGPGAKLASGAAMLAGHTYEQTDSPGEAAFAAASLPIMATGGKLAEHIAGKAGLIKPIVSKVSPLLSKAEQQIGVSIQPLLTTFGQKATQMLAHDVGANTTQFALEYAKDALHNKTWNPYGDQLYDKLLATTLGNVPYMVTGLPPVLSKEAIPFGPAKRIVTTDERPEALPTEPVQLDKQKEDRLSLVLRQKTELAEAQKLVNPSDRKVKVAELRAKHLEERRKFDEGIEQVDEYRGGDAFDYGFPDSHAPVMASRDIQPEVKEYHVIEMKPDPADRKKNIETLVHTEDTLENANKAASTLRGMKKSVRVEEFVRPKKAEPEVVVNTPEIDKDNVQTPVDVAQARAAAEVMRQQANLPPDEHQARTADALNKIGVKPDDAVKQAVVGDANAKTEVAKSKAQTEIEKAAAAHPFAGKLAEARRKAAEIHARGKKVEEPPVDLESNDAKARRRKELQDAEDIAANAKAFEDSVAKYEKGVKPDEFQGASGKKYRMMEEIPLEGLAEEEYAKVIRQSYDIVRNYSGSRTTAEKVWNKWSFELRQQLAAMNEMQIKLLSQQGWTGADQPLKHLKGRLLRWLTRDLQANPSKVLQRVESKRAKEKERNPDPDLEIASLTNDELIEYVAEKLDLGEDEYQEFKDSIAGNGLELGIIKFTQKRIRARREVAWYTDSAMEAAERLGELRETEDEQFHKEELETEKQGLVKKEPTHDDIVESLLKQIEKGEAVLVENSKDKAHLAKLKARLRVMLSEVEEQNLVYEPVEDFERESYRKLINAGKLDAELFNKIVQSVRWPKDKNVPRPMEEKFGKKWVNEKEVALWQKLVPDAFVNDKVDVNRLLEGLDWFLGGKEMKPRPREYPSVIPIRPSVAGSKELMVRMMENQGVRLVDQGKIMTAHAPEGYVWRFSGKPSERIENAHAYDLWKRPENEAVWRETFGKGLLRVVDKAKLLAMQEPQRPTDYPARVIKQLDPAFKFATDEAPSEPVTADKTGVIIGADGTVKMSDGTKIPVEVPPGKWIELPDVNVWAWRDVMTSMIKKGLLTKEEVEAVTRFKKYNGFRENALRDVLQRKGITGVKFRPPGAQEGWTSYLLDSNDLIQEFIGAGGRAFVLRTPAGGPFNFKLGELVSEKNGKLEFAGRTLDKDGAVPGQTFEAVASKNVSKEELALWKLIAPDAFKGHKVNVKKLADVLKMSPQIEVKKLSNADKSSGFSIRELYIELRNDVDIARHDLETLGWTYHPQEDALSKDNEVFYHDGYRWLKFASSDPGAGVTDILRHGKPVQISDDLVPAELKTYGERKKASEAFYQENAREISVRNNREDRARWSSIAPKAGRDMPGYVEVLVRIPVSKAIAKSWKDSPITVPVGDETKEILYSGSHFGENDINVVAFFRGYEETLPDGTKAFHVIEVQSDWGQKIRKQKESAKAITDSLIEIPDEGPATNELARRLGLKRWQYTLPSSGVKQFVFALTREEAAVKVTAKRSGTAEHPLLFVAEPLVLKAALDHARSVGATRLILSDAETAMMTEGHDLRSTKVRATPRNMDLAKRTRKGLHRQGQDSFYIWFLDKLVQGNDVTLENYDDVYVFQQWKFDLSISHEAGMRLHYDREIYHRIAENEATKRGWKIVPNSEGSDGKVTAIQPGTLNSILEKLTGQKGNKVELGTHVKGTGPIDLYSPKRRVEGSPFFKTAEGKPKTEITGLSYAIPPAPEQGYRLFGAQGKETSGLQSEPHTAPDKPMMPTGRSIFESLFRKTGYNERETTHWGQQMTNMRNLFGVLPVQFGELINDAAGSRLLGLANMGKLNHVFLARGLSPDHVSAREMTSTLAHEMGHLVRKAARDGLLSKEHAEKVNSWFEMATNEAHRVRADMDMLHELMPKDYRDLEIWKQWKEDTNPEEMFANTMAMWAVSKVYGEEGRQFASLMEPRTKGLFKTIGEYVRRFFGAIKGMLWNKPKMAGDFFKEGVKDTIKMFDEVQAALRDADVNLEALHRMTKMASAEIYDIRTSMLEEVPERAMAQKKGEDRSWPGKTETAWNYAFRTLNDLSASIPSLREGVATVLEHAPMSAKLARNAIAALYGGEDPSTGGINISFRNPEARKLRQFERKHNKKYSRLWGDIAQWMQQDDYPKGKAISEDLLRTADPEFMGKKLWPRVAELPEQVRKDLFDTLVKGSTGVHSKIAGHTVHAFKENTLNDLMFYWGVAKGKEGRWNEGRTVVRELDKALQQVSSADPREALTGRMMLEGLRQRFGDDKMFDSFVEDWVTGMSRADQLAQFFAKHPEHMSMIRIGKWKVKATNPTTGKDYVSALPDVEATYERWKKDVAALGYTKFETPEPVKRGEAIQLEDQVWQLIAEAETTRREKIEALTVEGMDPELLAGLKEIMLKGSDVAGEIARQVNAADVTIPGFIKGIRGGRKAIPGDMDMIETQRIYANMAGKLNATRMMRSKLAYELTNPELKKFPQEVDQLKRQMQNYLTPDTAFSRAVTKFNSQFMLALNIPTHLLNLMQSFHSVLPEAINLTGSIMKSGRLVAGAVKEVGKFTASLLREKIGLDKDHEAVKRMTDVEEQKLFRWFIDKGYWAFGHLGQLTDYEADAAMDVTKLASGGEPHKWSKALTRPIKTFGDTTMKLFAATEHFNQRIASLVGFRIARERMGKNFNREKAYEFALDFMRNTTYAGGKANRPLMQGDHKTVGNLAYNLQGYTVGWLNQAMRYMRWWKGSEYLNLTPHERENARKAALTMFGTMVASAGVLGMPFVRPLLRIFEKATGQDITGNLFVNLSKILQDDEEDGGGLADVILTGAANAALAKTGMPVDLGSRWAMSGMFGLDPYDGFAGDKVFGPTGQMVSTILAGFKGLASGDLPKVATSLSPNGLKKAVALALNDGVIRTSDGQPVASTGFDKFAYAAGFTPQTVSKINQFEGIKRSVGESTSAHNKMEAANILALLEKDPQAAIDALNKIAAAGLETPRQIAQRVATTAAEQTFPKDIRREMSGQQAKHLSEIARAIGAMPPQAQQVQREQLKQRIMMMLGQRPSSISLATRQADLLAQPFSPFFQAKRRSSMEIPQLFEASR